MDSDPWYAIRVRAQQETIASQSLRGRGLEEFLPMCESRRCWSDRQRVVRRPLISGYVFCRFSRYQLALVLDASGCTKVVKFGSQLAPVPDEDIQALRRLVESGLALPYSYVREGARVRIRAGAFKDLEGYVEKVKSQYHLIVSLHLLQRSVSVQLEANAVEAL